MRICIVCNSAMKRTAKPDKTLQRIWYEGSAAFWLLLPLSWLFAGVVLLRRKFYVHHLLRTVAVEVPVVVVGNITVGGTGKTPVTIWLARQLKERGMQPGIISRGYGAAIGNRPVRVSPDSDPAAVGDEAVLMARRSACPVVAHPNRLRAAREIIELGVDVIVSDDGLQHYHLARQFEIAVIDGTRGFGNGRMLPAGPLREPLSRLASVDRALINKSVLRSQRAIEALPQDLPVTDFYLKGTTARRLDDSEEAPLEVFAGRRVHAVAAIGNPARFFTFLESHGMQVIEHAFPDHSRLTAQDLLYDDGLDVMMTEKDAVKCGGIDTERCWYVPVEVEVDRPQAWLDDLQASLSANAGVQPR
jgi:tetraacyldisaccharide 4'-kinase